MKTYSLSVTDLGLVSKVLLASGSQQHTGRPCMDAIMVHVLYIQVCRKYLLSLSYYYYLFEIYLFPMYEEWNSSYKLSHLITKTIFFSIIFFAV